MTILRYSHLKKFPMHMWEHSACLSRFKIISVDHKRAESVIGVCFTTSDEKEVLELHAWIFCVATKVNCQRLLESC